MRSTIHAILWSCIALAGAAPAEIVRRTDEIVRDNDIAGFVEIEARQYAPGKIAGLVRNDGLYRVTDVVVHVRHAWVWPHRRSDEPHTYGWSDYVRLEGEIAPGASAPFASVHTPPLEVPADAGYLAEWGIAEVMQIRPMERP